MEPRRSVRHAKWSVVAVAAGVLFGLSLLGLPGTARADVQPGDVIGPENADQLGDLVTPGLEWCVRRGMPLTIVDTAEGLLLGITVTPDINECN